MNRKTDYYLLINRYLSNELTEAELSEFEFEIKFNPDLSEELNLHREVQQAVQEQDIVSMRENMNNILHHQVSVTENNDRKSIIPDSFNFGLAEELTSTNNFDGSISIDDIKNFTHSIPKIHLYQHISAAKENIYQFYKEQYEYDSLNDQESHSQLDNVLFEDIKSALVETDLLDLRANLKQIAANMPYHAESLKEIDSYVYDSMDKEQRSKFEEKVRFNNSLANDIQLFKDVDLAVAEKDIMDLRASLQKIQKSKPQSVSIEKIEGYIYEELTEHETALFEAALTDSNELNSEVELIRNIDRAIQEKDIMLLRDNLSNIAAENIEDRKTERSINIRFRRRKMVLSIAAACLLLLGITGILSRYSSEDNIYKEFYTKYETTGVSRSSNSNADQTLSLALQKFNNQDYESALNLLQEVIAKDQSNIVGRFYSGVSLQELGKYKNAIKEYEVVVVDKDNLFIEQAEWYIGLCYIQINEDKKAIQQFKKIANSQGFYQQKAISILKKMKNKI
jgi:ribosomal protein L22